MGKRCPNREVSTVVSVDSVTTEAQAKSVQTPVERIVSVLKGNGNSDAQNADLARKILKALEEPDVIDIREPAAPFRLVA